MSWIVRNAYWLAPAATFAAVFVGTLALMLPPSKGVHNRATNPQRFRHGIEV